MQLKGNLLDTLLPSLITKQRLLQIYLDVSNM